jgi:hypothetical protein
VIVVAAAARLVRDLFELPNWVPTAALLLTAAALPVVVMRARRATTERQGV